MIETYYIEELESNSGIITYKVYTKNEFRHGVFPFAKKRIVKHYISRFYVGKHESYYVEYFDNMEQINEEVDKDFASKVKEFNKQIKSTKLLKTINKST